MKYSMINNVTSRGRKHLVFYSVLIFLLVSFSSFAQSCYPDHRVLPKYENTKNFLSFENFGYRGIGRCRGHAIVAQKMDLLAKFNVKAPHPCSDVEPEACYSTIYNIVKQVMYGKIVEIGGFDSLYEFSKDPIARQVLRNRIITIRHKYQAEDSPLEINDGPNAQINVFNDIARRIALKNRPYIGIKGTLRISSHALIGYKVIVENNLKQICVRDPNVVIHEFPFENCQNFIYAIDDVLYYRQLGYPVDERLFLVTLKTDDDQRTAQYIKAHYEKCSKKKPRTSRGSGY